MLYPDTLQAAVLLSRPMPGHSGVTALAEAIGTALGAQGKACLHQHQPGSVEITCDAGLSLQISHAPAAPDMALLAQPMASPITAMLSPGISQRAGASMAHLLLAVSQQGSGATLEQFLLRLDRLALACELACRKAPAIAVHWTQSNQLLDPESFATLAAELAPGPLHLHPLLFGDGPALTSRRVGVRSLGARHFIGHEFLVEPGELPFAVHVEAMLGLLRLATSPGGYLIPHGDSFSDESGELAYRVSHRPALPGDVPLIVLEPLPFAPPPPLRRPRR